MPRPGGGQPVLEVTPTCFRVGLSTNGRTAFAIVKKMSAIFYCVTVENATYKLAEHKTVMTKANVSPCRPMKTFFSVVSHFELSLSAVVSQKTLFFCLNPNFWSVPFFFLYVTKLIGSSHCPSVAHQKVICIGGKMNT